MEFYTRLLDMPSRIALAENRVPSTKEWSPHIHIFFQMQDGSFLGFFELPEAPDMQRDPATPDWVQHLALSVESVAVLEDDKRRLVEAGIASPARPITASANRSISSIPTAIAWSWRSTPPGRT